MDYGCVIKVRYVSEGQGSEAASLSLYNIVINIFELVVISLDNLMSLSIC